MRTGTASGTPPFHHGHRVAAREQPDTAVHEADARRRSATRGPVGATVRAAPAAAIALTEQELEACVAVRRQRGERQLTLEILVREMGDRLTADARCSKGCHVLSVPGVDAPWNRGSPRSTT